MTPRLQFTFRIFFLLRFIFPTPALADDTSALQSALAAACKKGEVLRLPPGTFKISQPLVISGRTGPLCRGIVGSGFDTVLSTDLEIPLIVLDSSSGRLDDIEIGRMKLANTNANATSDDGILIQGNDWISHCRFHDIKFIATSRGIRNIMTAQKHDWNLYTLLDFENLGNKNVQSAIQFERGGGGTGNVFSNMTMICGTVCIQMGMPSKGTLLGLGDVLFSNLHMGAPSVGADRTPIGIKLRSGGVYGERISIIGSQFDAGLDLGIDIKDASQVTVVGNNFGGATKNSIINVKEYLFDGNGMGDTTPKLELRSEKPSVRANLLLSAGSTDPTPLS